MLTKDEKMELARLTISEAQGLLLKGEITPVDLVSAVIDRITTYNDRVNAYITVLEEDAMEQAKSMKDAPRVDILKHPLYGIPIAIKDLICTAGIRTTCASRILENFVPPYNATVFDAVKNAGAIIIGKTNMDEFAMGSSTENSAMGICRNPWDLDRIPGGSSGGSAAALAADMCLGALGSDTGGSIRQPASHCGIVGLKPTYGLVSRFGLVAFASSLDQIGPMTKSVRDAALLLNVIAAYDDRDSTSVPRDRVNYVEQLQEGLKGFTVGVPEEYFIGGIDEDVEKAVRRAIGYAEEMGAEIRKVNLPHTEYGVAVYYIIAPAEASSNLARYDGVKYGYRYKDAKSLIDMYCETRSKGFGAEVKRRIMLGTYVLSAGYYDAYYRKASQVRTLIKRDFDEAFEKCDVLITPVAPTTAFKIGEKADDPLQMYLTDIFTLPASLAGIPGMSIPCGLDGKGMPVGVQILAAHLNESKIFRVAYNLEKAIGFERKKLPVG